MYRLRFFLFTENRSCDIHLGDFNSPEIPKRGQLYFFGDSMRTKVGQNNDYSVGPSTIECSNHEDDSEVCARCDLSESDIYLVKRVIRCMSNNDSDIARTGSSLSDFEIEVVPTGLGM